MTEMYDCEMVLTNGERKTIRATMKDFAKWCEAHSHGFTEARAVSVKDERETVTVLEYGKKGSCDDGKGNA